MISPTRNSVVRHTRESSDTSTMAPMKNAAIFTPSGRSITLTTVVYAKITATSAAAQRRRFPAAFLAPDGERHGDGGLVISTSTPVA